MKNFYTQVSLQKPSCYCMLHTLFSPLLFYFSLLFSLPLLAQHAKPVNIETLTVEDGLSQSVVYTMAQDKKGFIWMATFNGLDRYDGNEFVHFRHDGNDSFSISSSQVLSIFEDTEQRLWIGTWDNGLNYFDPVHRRFYHFFPGKHIEKIAEDAEGNLYVNDSKTITHLIIKQGAGNGSNGCPFTLDTVSFTIPEYFYARETAFCFLFTDALKNVYTTTQTGLYLLGFNKASSQISFTKLYGYNYTYPPPTFFQDKKTQKYYLLNGNAVLESNNNRFSNAVKVHNGITFYRSVFIDNQSRLWYTANESTYTFNLKTKQEKLFASLAQNSDYDFAHLVGQLQDKNGTLWFATNSSGIVKYADDENYFHSVLPGKYVGRIKITGDSEFYVYNRYRVRLEKDSASITDLSTDEVNSYLDFPFIRDKDGTFWHITETAVKHSDASFRLLQSIPIPYLNFGPIKAQLPPAKNKPLRDTFCSTIQSNVVLLDKDDCLWFCCAHGFVYYDTKSNEFHFIDKGTGSKKMYEDGSGNIWMSVDGGACVHNKQTGVTFFYNWKPDNNNRSLADKNTTCFCDDPVDPQHLIWIGTRNGLSRMNKNTGNCQNFTDKTGLPDNLIYDILPDSSGNLWMSTNKGLCRLHAADFSIRNFNKSDGLQGSEFNGGAAVTMKNGTLVFGGTNGLTYFNPKEVTAIAPPLTVVTGYKLFGKAINNRTGDDTLANDVAYKNDVAISYKNNVVTFAFAGIDYRKKGALQYRYKLTPFDKDWNYAGIAHEATYTNLNPGNYGFVAEASNTNNVWGKPSRMLAVHILPMWWQTWWFYALVAMAAFALIYLVYRYQLNQALKVQRVRNRIARDLHDEIGSTLSAITLFSDMAHEQSKTAMASPQLLKKINETSQKVTGAMRDIVWSVSTKNDSFEKMITHMHEHAAELLELKNYELYFRVDEKIKDIHLSMEKRQNIYLIYKEALNNIVKYACGKQVWVSIRKEKFRFLLSVKDDGVGFDACQQNGGNGLPNMKNRAASLGGTIHIISAAGCGCEIHLSIPV